MVELEFFVTATIYAASFVTSPNGISYFTRYMRPFLCIREHQPFFDKFAQHLFFKPFLASVPAVLSAWLCYRFMAGIHSKLATLVAICAAVVVYFIAVLLFRLIKKEEVLMIPKGNKIYGLLHKMKLM